MKFLKMLVLLLLSMNTSSTAQKISSPNGGERLVMGSTIDVTWTGIPSNETVGLEFSVDGGHSYTLITDSATGLLYKWKVPTIYSKQCKVRMRRFIPSAQSGSSGEQNNYKVDSTYVSSLAVDPTGTFFVAGYGDNVVRKWNIETGKLIASMKYHSLGVTCVAYSPDGRFIASGSSDKTIVLWSAETGDTLRVIKGHSNAVFAVAFSPDGQYLLSGSRDNSVKLWNVADGSLVRTYEGHVDFISSVNFSPDGRKIITGCADKGVRIYGIDSTTTTSVFFLHTDRINSVRFDSKGKHFVSASNDKGVRVYDPATGLIVANLTGHDPQSYSAQFGDNDRLVVSSGGDRFVKIWNVKSRALLFTYKGHGSSVNAVQFTPDGNFILSGGADGWCKLWELFRYDPSDGVFSIVPTAPLHLLSPNGGEKFVEAKDAVVTWENVGANDFVRLELSRDAGKTWAKLTDSAFNSTYSWKKIGPPASKECLIRATQRNASTADTSTVIKTFDSKQTAVTSLSFSHDGQTLISSGTDKTAKSWDWRAGTVKKTFSGHGDNVRSSLISTDGTVVATACDDNKVRLFNSATAELIREISGHTGAVTSLSMSLDGTLLASGSRDGKVMVWSTSDGSLFKTLDASSSGALATTISHDKKTVAVGAVDKKMFVYDLVTGMALKTVDYSTANGTAMHILDSETNFQAIVGTGGSSLFHIRPMDYSVVTVENSGTAIGPFAVSPNGKQFVGGTSDLTVRLWDIVSGKLQHVITTVQTPVTAVAISPDGKTVAIGQQNGMISTARIFGEDQSDAHFEIEAKPISVELVETQTPLVHAFPNPANTSLCIKRVTSDNQPMSFELRDISGRLLVSESCDPTDAGSVRSIDLTLLNSGVYPLLIVQGTLRQSMLIRVLR